MLTGMNFQAVEKLLGNKIEQLHISAGTIDEINRSEASWLIEQSFTTDPMEQCVRLCGDHIEQEVDDERYMGCNTRFKKINVVQL